MTKALIGIGVLGAFVVSAPMLFVAFLLGPQAVTEAAGVNAACQMMLGMAPGATTTVGELGGPEAAAVAAALAAPATDPDERTDTSPPVAPLETVAAVLQGERAYEFVSTLNTIDNWRSLPVDDLARWAVDPITTALPAGAVLLPELPRAQIDALAVTYQAPTVYGRSCAAVVSRATAIKLDPATLQRRAELPAPDLAAVAAMAGTQMTNLDLLRHVDPWASEADPRQFYLNYRATSDGLGSARAADPGDIVVFDFTTSGPAHFGIAVDAGHMISTGTFGSAAATVWAIPGNAATMSTRAQGPP